MTTTSFESTEDENLTAAGVICTSCLTSAFEALQF
jgi:hypothetical protein